MKSLKWIVLFVGFVPAWLNAADTARSAKLVAVTGSVSIGLPAGGSGSPTVGADLPVGSSITTSAGSQATVSFFDGTTAIIQPESSVSLQEHSVAQESGASKENTLLDLRSGGVIASLDPAKKNITNFKVRTPKGVAAARGTVFAVRITPDRGTSVTTMSGTVTFVTDQGEFTVAYGQVSTGSTAMSVADAVKANPGLAAEILEATSDVAKAVGNGSVANTEGSPNLISAVLAALVDVAIQAAPGNAVETLKSLISSAGPALQGSDGAGIVQAMTESAINAAGESSRESLETASQEAADEASISPATGDPVNPPLPQLDEINISTSRQ